MARTPSMSAPEAEGLLGTRGQLMVTADNKSTVKKWMTANGIPGLYASGLAYKALAAIYNDKSNVALERAREAAIKAQAEELFGTDIAETATMHHTIAVNGNGHDTTATGSFGNTDNSEQVTRVASLLTQLLATPSLDTNAVKAIINGEIQTLESSLPDLIAKHSPLTRIEIKRADETTHVVEGITHPQFKTLLALATARNADGFVPGIFISGEASSGKTFGCKQLASALGGPWHFNGAISFPHEMLGFIDGNGNYHRTAFREAYEHGGVYTFDEVDRSDPVALLAVNPHLANGVATFPDGQIKRHRDCIIIGTANTWGLGANADYAGATKLDAAFLSRFPRRLSWNIDETMERALSGNEQWAFRIQRVRDKARKSGLKVMIDTRMTYAGASLIANGMSEDDAARVTYLANLSDEQRRIVES